MRPSRIFRAATALWLVALLGAMATGLPHGHLHGADRAAATTVSSADQHAHGIGLVDQVERVAATAVALPVASAHSGLTLVASATRALAVATHAALRPTGRAPPSARPRAPPRIA